jgi:dGTPase
VEWKKLLCSDRVRNYTSSSSGDFRTEYEKDYHRIIGSASFRRLQDKTQVFPLERSDFVRTRLTHSLEVSSFAKSLGQNISRGLQQNQTDSEFLPEYQGYVCDILQCAGLLHDIGNPPFGHFGETAIRDWFRTNLPKISYKRKDGRIQFLDQILSEQMKRDFYYFEGNTQALRLVAKLHYLVDENGMNLTKALLGTIIKYPGSSLERKSTSHIKYKKMGYYYAERELFADLQASLGTGGNRHPLAFVLEAADDIAYKTADLEDAVKKGCISYEQLVAELEQAERKLEKEAEKAKQPEQKKPPERIVTVSQIESFHKMTESLKRKYERAKQRGLKEPGINAVQNWAVYVQGWMINDATDSFIRNYTAVMDGTYGTHGEDLFTGTGGEAMMDALGDIAYRYAFQIKPILKLEIAAQSVFDFLLERFVQAALYYDTGEELTEVQKKLMELLSDNYIAIYRRFAQEAEEGKGAEEEKEAEKLYLRLLLVTDYICGMTDSYAKRLYQELKGID